MARMSGRAARDASAPPPSIKSARTAIDGAVSRFVITSGDVLFDFLWPRAPDSREEAGARSAMAVLADLHADRRRCDDVPIVVFVRPGLLFGAMRDLIQRPRAQERLRESLAGWMWELDAQRLYTYAGPSLEMAGDVRDDRRVAKRFFDLWVRSPRETPPVPAVPPAAETEPLPVAARDAVSASGVVEEAKEPRPAERESVTVKVAVRRTLGVVGESPAIREVLFQVRQVAPTGSSVLISGETGTGKELIAHALHQLSPRRGRAMVAVNCAALPAGLVESELFGHEKGAYTGAVSTQAGRFELASGSTLFLDEIGELSGELQAKLLRVLDEGQLERLGSARSIVVDVRLVAATNRDLAEEVRQGRFRKDLYYRLNVFPIRVPPLRERRDDIPLLVGEFAGYFGERLGKVMEAIPDAAMRELQQRPWPGNVRELRNAVERAVILSGAGPWSFPPSEPEPDDADGAPEILTLAELERRHITQVLAHTRGRISGRGGAASLLGVSRTTLQSMLKRLGIARTRDESGPL
jgi:DNA-binding NtrC family response regulator